jgi:outer membrane protein with beta-barrel domain
VRLLGSHGRMRHSLLFFFGATLVAHAQIASFGVKAGVPVTSAVPYAGLDQEPGRWEVGLTAEFHLISGLSAEVDALFRGYAFVLHDGAPAANSYRLDAKAWDFPFLLKYRFLGGPVRPFVDVGYSLTHESFDESTLVGQTKNSRNGSGPAGGVGVEFKFRKVRIAPEARYTHPFHSGITGSNGNLLTVLVGLTF